MASQSAIVVGLGNPGPKYARTRHNMGFMLLDKLVEDSASAMVTIRSGWKDKFGALVSEVLLGRRQTILIKPQNFMNLSGGPVRDVAGYFGVGLNDIVVAHDEIDLPFGTLRMKMGGGDGGHNGVRSIASELGGREFFRLRLGIGHPFRDAGEPGSGSGTANAVNNPDAVADWVLSRFARDEEAELGSFLGRGTEALRCLIEDGLAAAQGKYNG